MKSSKLTSADPLTGGRRSQPPRLTRNNPPRSSTFGSRSYGTKASARTATEELPPIEIFPAITHFADAISALPKELIRHFTLLKEVDAKIFIPEEELMKLVSDALNTPPPPYSRHIEGQGENMLGSAQTSTPSGSNNTIMNGCGSSAHTTSNVWDPANFNRRKLFNKCTLSMQGMLVSLDEKNHVISTAAEALAKQLARIDDCFPFIDLEISEEARNGSKTHWAYPENRISKSNSGGHSVKEQNATNQSHTAVQIPGEDSTNKSDTKKQSLVDKRKNRNQQTDADMIDQPESKQKDKKSNGNSKARKANDTPIGVAVGITHSITPNNNSSKRRKVERGPANGTNLERLTNSSHVNGVTAGKGRPSSPGSTPPQPESSRKRARALPITSNGLTNRKRQIVTTPATLLSLSASPPISKNVSETKNVDKKSPPPSNNGRPTTGRCRQSSVQSTGEKKSISPSKSKSHVHSTPDRKNIAAAAEISRRNSESSMKKTSSTVGSQDVYETFEKTESRATSVTNLSSKGNIPVQRESSETDQDSLLDLQSSTFTTTKSGRTSKPSTPSSSLFPDMARSRGIRTPLEIVNSRRSHKKGAGIISHMAATQNIDIDDAEKKRNNNNEDVDLDADEPRYCLCNNVSYGEMVACDSKGCKREWFHLACVGLKTAPKGDATWYCEDCKEATKGKRSNNNR
ncbi:putative phd-finger domain-containing protein [Erysiphe neolycopersici]|uniref:Chromatin modification-related protein n=1 Tax=Erysiphe neolycopersici TaxID=212602 RepID=A0A420HZV0_9PEZI|nr:putative phd-finger domain-containing protein [Erysiphe neolycopersici]